jgi:hypothetical protein
MTEIEMCLVCRLALCDEKAKGCRIRQTQVKRARDRQLRRDLLAILERLRRSEYDRRRQREWYQANRDRKIEAGKRRWRERRSQ